MNDDFDLFVGIALIGLVLWGASCGASYECSTKAEIMKKAHSYGLIQGCMIEAKPGEWIDINKYRVVD